jgi:hypothetical protein
MVSRSKPVQAPRFAHHTRLGGEGGASASIIAGIVNGGRGTLTTMPDERMFGLTPPGLRIGPDLSHLSPEKRQVKDRQKKKLS